MHQSKDVTKTLQLHRQDYPWKSLRGVILETQGQKVQHSQGFSPDKIVDLNLSHVIWKVPLLKHQHHAQYGNYPLVMRGTQEMSLSEQEANSCLPSHTEYLALPHAGSRMPAPFKRCFFLPALVHMQRQGVRAGSGELGCWAASPTGGRGLCRTLCRLLPGNLRAEFHYSFRMLSALEKSPMIKN